MERGTNQFCFLEATAGFEPANRGFADLSNTPKYHSQFTLFYAMYLVYEHFLQFIRTT